MEQNYVLTSENVDVISDVINKYMVQLRMPRKAVIRGRLVVETVLLAWLEKVPEGTEICLTMGKRFFRPYVNLQFAGEKVNPLDISQDEELGYYGELMNNVGLSVGYQYIGDSNFVTINLPMVDIGNSWKILMAVLLAVATSFVLGQLDNVSLTVVIRHFVEPVFTSVISFLSALAAFMIFFNILSSTISMGDVSNINRNGLKLLRSIIGHNFLAVIIGMIICFFAFDVVELRADLTFFDLEALFKLLVGIIPDNLVKPFIDGDTLKIIFLAVSAGILLLVMGERGKKIKALVRECNEFFSIAINYFCSMFPLIVYLALTNVLLRGNLQHIWAVGKILFVVVIIGAVYLVQDVFLSAVHARMGIKRYVVNLIPMFKVALFTGNAAASGELFDKTCSKIGFVKSFYEYGSLVTQVLTASGTIIVLLCTITGFQEYCGQTISLSEFLVSGLVYVLIAPSTFAIPGGSISVMTILMSQSFLPDFCIIVYIATNLLFDMLITAINQVSCLNNLVCAASALNMISKKN